MASINEIIRTLKESWSAPRSAFHSGAEIPFKLSCSFEEVRQTVSDQSLPGELREFWSSTESARLFEDKTYGQWGLEILSQHDAASRTQRYKQERHRDARPGDFIIGRFLGDSDLLMIRCDEAASDFGKVGVVLPLDPREDWDWVGDDFEDFLNHYANEQGAKYWESR